jgi:tetratricopeptide (TPR) repeat protein
MENNFCPKCGNPVLPGNTFCSGCGTDLPTAPRTGASEGNRTKRDLIIAGGLLAIMVAGYFIFFPAREPLTGNDSEFQHPQISGMTSETAPDFQKIMDGLPKAYDSLVQMGNHFMDNQVYPMAIECYRRALNLKSDNPDVITDLGVCLYSSGDGQKAIDQFEKAVTLNPAHAAAYFNMGIVYRELNNMEKAKAAWRKFLELAPHSPMADTIKNFLK